MPFEGFSPELIGFLRNLGANNNREWFQAHRLDYENYLLEPAREFVLAMGECLPKLGEGIHAEPRVHGSIFAINRVAAFEQPLPADKVFSDQLPGLCFEHYARLAPLQQWLVDLLPE